MVDELKRGHLSVRGKSNVDSVMPRIPRTILEAGNTEDEDSIIDMSVAENWLIRDEIIEIQKEATEKELTPETFSWPKGFWGDPALLKDLAMFFNEYFSPIIPVIDKHISLAPGVAHTIDTVLFNICDPGDGVLCPAPYWNGYDTFCRLRPDVSPVLVEIGDLSNMTSFTENLEQAYNNSKHVIKGIIITNPHNPLGRCFSKDALEVCLRFCQSKDIHLISDEIFGPFTFGPTDNDHLKPFTSVLSIDLNSIDVSPSRVHVLWGPSKVFALAGARVGCIVTQANDELRNGTNLASLATVSSLSTLLVKELLRSPRLPEIIKAYTERSYKSYQTVTRFFRRLNIPYLDCNAGPFILAKIAPDAVCWQDESAAINKLRDVKVWVSPGRSHHLPEHEKGWARITFALEAEKLETGLRRIEAVLNDKT